MEEENVVKNETNQEAKKQSTKSLILEIIRFLLVGGLATLVDWFISYLLSAVLPTLNAGSWNVKDTLATIGGFCVGLFVNYFLSIIFVYKDKKDENEGKSFKDFLIFATIGVLVLLFQILFNFLVNDLWFTKGLQWEVIFIGNLTWGYIISKVCATAIGLVLNYTFRKLIIFK